MMISDVLLSDEDRDKAKLFRMQGILGQKIGSFWRQKLIDVIGRPKIGKSYFLLEMAMTAWKQRNNILYLTIGDSAMFVRKRLTFMLTGKHWHNPDMRRINYPKLDCAWNQVGKCARDKNRKCSPIILPDGRMGDFANFPEHKCCNLCRGDNRYFHPVVWNTIIENPNSKVKPLPEAFTALKDETAGKRFSLHEFGIRELTVAKLQGLLRELEVANSFRPDVIIVDYADYMAVPEDFTNTPIDPIKRTRDIWLGLNHVAWEHDCAVITATQDFRDSITEPWEDDEGWEKMTYSDAIVMDQTVDEKMQGIMRIYPVTRWDGIADTSEGVTVLQCLQTGKPYLDSFSCSKKTV